MLCSRLARLSLQKSLRVSNVSRQNIILRGISTSKKNSDATATTTTATAETEHVKGKSTWQSYGFGINEHADYANMHLSFFFGITGVFVLCSFYVAYAPSEMDWEQRESYLELRRREKLGLPLIDKNYIDPSCMILPSEEELGDSEIII